MFYKCNVDTDLFCLVMVLECNYQCYWVFLGFSNEDLEKPYFPKIKPDEKVPLILSEPREKPEVKVSYIKINRSVILNWFYVYFLFGSFQCHVSVS